MASRSALQMSASSVNGTNGVLAGAIEIDAAAHHSAGVTSKRADAPWSGPWPFKLRL
jgi:hypothetical protein